MARSSSKKLLTNPDAWYSHWVIYAITISILPCLVLGQWIIYLLRVQPALEYGEQGSSVPPWLPFTIFPIVGFIIIPLIDMITLPIVERLYHERNKQYENRDGWTKSQITATHSRRAEQRSERKRQYLLYSIVMYWYVILHTVVFFCSMHWIGMYMRPLSPEFILAALSVAMISVAPGVAVGHELFHKLSWYESALGNWMMHLFMYGHFKILHCHHHHKWVATPHDPATAQYGESIFTFIPRSAISGYILTWDIEMKRLKEKNVPFFSLQNRMLVAFMISFVVLPLGVYMLFGTSALAAFIFQSVASIVMVETVNYFEHYGLQRQRLKKQDSEEPQMSNYEPVTHMHSWDAFYPLSNYLSLNLNFHAFHHEHPIALYKDMQPTLQSPRMPLPYPFMFIVAVIPPLFFRTVHPLLSDNSNNNLRVE